MGGKIGDGKITALDSRELECGCDCIARGGRLKIGGRVGIPSSPSLRLSRSPG